MFPAHPLPLYKCPHYNEIHLIYEYNYVHRAVTTIEASGYFCTRRFQIYIYMYNYIYMYITDKENLKFRRG